MNRPSPSSLTFLGEPGFVMDNLLGGHVLDASLKIQPGKMGQYFQTQDTIEFDLKLLPFKDPLRQNTLMDFVMREGKFEQVRFCFDEKLEYTFFGCIAVDFYEAKSLRFVADYYTLNYV